MHMTMSKDLFLSILAMDAYNRGYNPGIDVSASDGIGNATILDQAAQVNASFYAVAYDVGTGVSGLSSGTTVISYRGTDEPYQELVQVDFAITYASSYQQQQIMLAQQFYDDVQASVGGNVLLTGHSLGGALAGWTAAVNETDAVMVDNIGFFNALEAFVDVYNLMKEYLSFPDWSSAYAQFQADTAHLDHFDYTGLIFRTSQNFYSPMLTRSTFWEA
jgi:hypothetical protein